MGVRSTPGCKNDNGRILLKALTDINPQDVFEIDSDNAYTSGDSYKKEVHLLLICQENFLYIKTESFYRMKNGSVTKEIAEKYASQ